MDIITLLKNDHKTVEDLYNQYQNGGEKALKYKQKLVQEMLDELKVHAMIDEELFYPSLKKSKETKNLTFESYEDHSIA